MALSAQDPANHPGRVHACVPACVTVCGARLCANVHVCEYIMCSSTCTDASVCLQARVREHTHLYARVCPVCVCARARICVWCAFTAVRVSLFVGVHVSVCAHG